MDDSKKIITAVVILTVIYIAGTYYLYKTLFPEIRAPTYDKPTPPSPIPLTTEENILDLFNYEGEGDGEDGDGEGEGEGEDDDIDYDNLLDFTPPDFTHGPIFYWNMEDNNKPDLLREIVSANDLTIKPNGFTYSSNKPRFGKRCITNVNSRNRNPIIGGSNHELLPKGNKSLSVSIWFKMTGTPEDGSNDVISLFSMGHSNIPKEHGSFYIFVKRDLSYVGFSHNPSPTIITRVPVTKNEWHHLVAVREKTSKKDKLYYDGEFQADYDLTLVDWNVDIGLKVSDIKIGDGPSDSNMVFSPGMVDEISVFSYALNDKQVKSLYNGADLNKFRSFDKHSSHKVKDIGEGYVDQERHECHMMCQKNPDCHGYVIGKKDRPTKGRCFLQLENSINKQAVPSNIYDYYSKLI